MSRNVLMREIEWFGRRVTLACDGRCEKAWGVNNRPTRSLNPHDPDDYESIPDSALGTAPEDPGTYEGGHAKPRRPEERLNKWCARECERSVFAEYGERIVLRDMETRWRNIPEYARRKP